MKLAYPFHPGAPGRGLAAIKNGVPGVWRPGRFHDIIMAIRQARAVAAPSSGR